VVVRFHHGGADKLYTNRRLKNMNYEYEAHYNDCMADQERMMQENQAQAEHEEEQRLRTYQDKINELVEIEGKIKKLKVEGDQLREELKSEIILSDLQFLETNSHKVEVKQKQTYCWDESIKDYLKTKNIISYFVEFSDTKIKNLLKEKKIGMEDKLEIDRLKYIAETKNILYLKAK